MNMLERAADAVNETHVNCAGYMDEESRRRMAHAVLLAALNLSEGEVQAVADAIAECFDLGSDERTYAMAAILALQAACSPSADGKE